MKLSIIIPIFRTESTLSRCIDSVLSQSFTDYEILLIDDGSTDRCPELCNQYAKADPRVKVFHQKHAGLSEARNTGIQHAQGEFITFIDSDDEIEKNTLQKLMADLKADPEIDILEYPALERIGHPTQEKMLKLAPRNYENGLEYWFDCQAFKHTYAWNKVYRKSLFEHVRFPASIAFEDAHILPVLIGILPYDKEGHCLNPKIRTTNVGLYKYYWNEDGITANAHEKELQDLYDAHDKTFNRLVWTLKFNPDLFTRYNKGLQAFMLQILNILLDLYELRGYETNIPSLVKELPDILDLTVITSVKLNVLSLIGYRRLCKLSKLIHKIRSSH